MTNGDLIICQTQVTQGFSAVIVYKYYLCRVIRDVSISALYILDGRKPLKL